MCTKISLAAVLILVIRAFALPASAQEAKPDPFLPPGEGRERVVAVCTSCHSARAFGQLREGPQGWRLHVYEMILHGAQVAPADLDPIVNYLATALGPGVPLPGPPPAQVTLPEGAGKEMVQGVCSLCHGLDRVVSTKRSAQQWERVIERMMAYGTPLSAENVKIIADYLSTHAGNR